MTRAAEIRGGLADVRERIRRACDAAKRPDDVTLIVVTKNFPASDIRILADEGVTDVGENRHQEAAAKAAECSDLPLTWHMIGQLQRNKAAAVLSWADLIHTVDRTALADAIDRAALAAGVVQDVLVQVSLDQPVRPDRGGCDPGVLEDVFAVIQDAPNLRLRGVMSVAPYPGDPEAAFRRLAELAARVRALDPSATIMSAGMSDDLTEAIAQGATHVRVGSAVLGRRAVLE